VTDKAKRAGESLKDPGAKGPDTPAAPPAAADAPAPPAPAADAPATSDPSRPPSA
jgi:hypothetical protein